MIVILRFMGIVNAAVWLGAALFFTFAAVPAIFSPEMKRVLTTAYAGVAAQAVVGSYFVLQYWCGGLALVHQLAEWVYLGKRIHRFTFGLLLVMNCLGLFGGVWLQPRMKAWYLVKYSAELYRRELYSPEQKDHAARLFRQWHGVSQGLNLLTLGGLAYYLWRVTIQADSPRFVPSAKFKS